MNTENNKWLIIINPKASIGKSEKDWPEIQQLLTSEGIDFDFVMTEKQGHAIQLVRDLITEKGYQKIVSVGGDGTNNEVINGIFTQKRFPTTEIMMGVIPIGTGNDWCRTFNFTLDYRDNVKTLKEEYLFKHDIGKVTYYNDGDPQVRYFLNGAGTGLDEAVCKSTNKMKQQGKGGSIRYLISVVKCLIKCKTTHLQLFVDDQMVVDDEIMSLSVGNCRFNGSGLMMMPKAIPNDGMFDVTTIRKVGVAKFGMNLSNMQDGSFVDKLKEVTTYQGRKLRIVSIPSHKLMLETEGETLNNSPFDFEMLQESINMVVPKNSSLLQQFKTSSH